MVNMTTDLTTIVCNLVLGYRVPLDLLTVHDVDDGYKMVGTAHLATGQDVV